MERKSTWLWVLIGIGDVSCVHPARPPSLRPIILKVGFPIVTALVVELLFVLSNHTVHHVFSQNAFLLESPCCEGATKSNVRTVFLIFAAWGIASRRAWQYLFSLGRRSSALPVAAQAPAPRVGSEFQLRVKKRTTGSRHSKRKGQRKGSKTDWYVPPETARYV